MGDTTDDLLTLAKKVSANPDRRELDMLLSAGERISMALLSMAIRELGGDAISFTGSQSGIITNDRHVDARIIEVRPFRVQDELARGRIVVIAGYQGVSYKKEVTTLGRGGSDTTAVAMAAALDAEYCEICSDVDGVYSADPRVVPDARAHRHVVVRGNAGDGGGRREGAERAGGRVREGERDRDLRARDGRTPAGPGSFERRHGGPAQPAAHARHRRRRRQRTRHRHARRHGSAEDLLAVLAERRSRASSSMCSATERPSPSRARTCTMRSGCVKRSRRRSGSRARLIDGLAAVSVVGAGINATYDNVRAGLETLAALGVAPAGIATSSFRITWMIPRERMEDVVRALHGRFIESQRPLLPSE